MAGPLQAVEPRLDQELIASFLNRHPYPLLFVTVSGAHLYGFASADSDCDLRGCHITPVQDLVALSPPSETYEVLDREAPVEMDIVTHDIRKFFSLLLKNNGYVLEQAASPLVVAAMPEFEELRALLPRCVTRNHRYHFLRFGQNQWEGVTKGGRPTVKGLLYTYRVLLAGIHLMRTGRIESNLRQLNEFFHLPYIDELIAKKTGSSETGMLDESLEWHHAEFVRLCAELDKARDESSLPDEASCQADLNDLLVRVRMKHLH